MKNNKFEIFTYTLYQLVKWYLCNDLNSNLTEDDIVRFNKNNDFGKLKVLKLLFLITIVSPEKKLLDIFDNFYAMQYGPVESDIYKAIMEDSNPLFTISNSDTTVKKLHIPTIDSAWQQVIDGSINSEYICSLKHKSYSYLVDLTHMYKSWNQAFNRGIINGKAAYPMAITQIQNDEYIQ